MINLFEHLSFLVRPDVSLYVVLFASFVDIFLLHRFFKNKFFHLSFFLLVWLFSVLTVYVNYPSEVRSFLVLYFVEFLFSLDNLVIIALFLQFSGTGDEEVESIVSLGVFLAIASRLGILFLGIKTISHIDWLIILFAIFLAITSFQTAKSIFSKKDSEFSWLEKIARKYISKNKYMIVFFIVFADFITSLDSVSVGLTMTKNSHILFLANILSLLGLRFLFFYVEEYKESLIFKVLTIICTLAISCKIMFEYIGMSSFLLLFFFIIFAGYFFRGNTLLFSKDKIDK